MVSPRLSLCYIDCVNHFAGVDDAPTSAAALGYDIQDAHTGGVSYVGPYTGEQITMTVTPIPGTDGGDDLNIFLGNELPTVPNTDFEWYAIRTYIW